MYVICLFKGSFGLFNAYLILFDQFLPKTEDKKIPIINSLKIYIYIIKTQNVDKNGRVVGGGSANVDNN